MQSTKDDLLYWSKRLYQKGMTPGTSGNVSVKINDKILISRSGVCLNDMSEADLVLIDKDGNSLEKDKKPSSEKFLHICIYEKRDDIKAIMHSHCPYITAFAVANKKIESPILPEFIFNIKDIPLAPYATPSGLELAQKTAKYFDNKDAVLMANHGIVVGADTLKNCFYLLETIRTYCETYFAAEILGGAKKLNSKQIMEIEKLKG